MCNVHVTPLVDTAKPNQARGQRAVLLNSGFWAFVRFEILENQNLEIVVKNCVNLEILKKKLSKWFKIM